MKDYLQVEVTGDADAVTRYLHIIKIFILFSFFFNLIITFYKIYLTYYIFNFIVIYMLKILLKILHCIQLKIIMFLWYLKMLKNVSSL